MRRRKHRKNSIILDLVAILVTLFISILLLSSSVSYLGLLLKLFIRFLIYFIGFLGCIFLVYWFFRFKI